MEDLPSQRESWVSVSKRSVVLGILAGATFITLSMGLAEFVLSFQALYPVGTPEFRAFWGLPFGWLRRTIVAPPPTMSSSSLPVTVYDSDLPFFLLDLIFWVLVLGSIVRIRQWGVRRRLSR